MKALKGKTWEEIYGIEGAKKRRQSLILKKFSSKLIKGQKDIPPEFAQIVNENFKDLLY